MGAVVAVECCKAHRGTGRGPGRAAPSIVDASDSNIGFAVLYRVLCQLLPSDPFNARFVSALDTVLRAYPHFYGSMAIRFCA